MAGRVTLPNERVE